MRSSTVLRERLPVSLRRALRATKARIIPPPSAELLALFDADFYVERYPDVRRSGIDPLEHYRSWGRKQGRSPNLLFDVAYYGECYPGPQDEVLSLLSNPRRSPHPLFDPASYLDRYPGVGEAGMHPLVHYLEHGIGEGRIVRPAGHAWLLAEPDWVENWRTPSRSSAVKTIRESLDVVMTLANEIDLLTLDFWDTLVARTRPADAAKLATCERLMRWLGLDLTDDPWQLYDLRQRVEHEIAMSSSPGDGLWGEYLMEDVFVGMLAELGVGADPRELAAELAEAEISDEISYTRVVDGANDLLGFARQASLTTVVLSDFYVSSAGLRRIASGIGLDLDGIDIAVSCETGVSKSVGTAFAEIRAVVGCSEPQGHLHIGDNEDADGLKATNSGARSLLVERSTVGAHPGALRHASAEVVALPLVSSVARSAPFTLRQPPPEHTSLSSEQVRAARTVGVLIAPAAVALVCAAIADAERLRAPAVHYLSREGEVFRDVHNAIGTIVSSGCIEARHLAVSRLATFGPSVNALDRDSMMRLWTMYPNQSPAALLTSLGLDTQRFAPHLRVHGLDLDRPIDAIFADDRVRRFLEDPAVSTMAAHDLRAARSLAEGYLRQQVATGSGHDDVVVVDIGWRGTIQDNLAHLIPEWTWHGWYLALFPFLNPQRPNVRKRAIGPDANRGDDAGWIEPVHAVELALSSQSPSVERYHLVDGVFSPVFTSNTLGPRLARQMSDEVRRGLLATVRSAATAFAAHGNAAWLFGPTVRNTLHQLANDPPRGLADLVFESAHDETFGVLNELPFVAGRPDRGWLSYDNTAAALAAIDARANQSRWAKGYRRWAPIAALRATLGDVST